jgi:tetratricopeptide (TPR) repeat protein
MRAGRDAVAVFVAVGVMVLAIGGLTARAQAGVVEDAAHEHYRRGTAAYNLGKYQEAAKEYEQAYEATLDPALLFNVAQAYRLAGDRKRAITTYRSYLRSAPNGAERGLAELKLKELESQPNAEAPPVPPPAPEQPVAPGPSSPSPAPPGPLATPDLQAEGTGPPSSPPAAVTLERDAEPAAATPLYKRWPFWAVTGAVAAAIVVAGGSSNASPDTNLGTMRF